MTCDRLLAAQPGRRRSSHVADDLCTAIAGLHHRAGDRPEAVRTMSLVLDGARVRAETGVREGAPATIAEAAAR